MENKQYIVALEIASSHIAGVVASVGGEGHRDASIVCYHEVPIVDCVRYGSIVNEGHAVIIEATGTEGSIPAYLYYTDTMTGDNDNWIRGSASKM